MTVPRKLSWPLHRDGSSLATHGQDSIVDVAQGVRLMLRTAPNGRPLSPDVGFDDPTHVGFDEADITRLADLEPRARLEAEVEVSDDGRTSRRRIYVDLSDQPDSPEAA